ncbi:peptidase M23 [Streptomyces sp. NPDC004596]|uniref:peptidase M23 n=1 Tax=Streptomyces sp. DSM 118148 TaxID=3448667 RepID=UPI00403FCB5C
MRLKRISLAAAAVSAASVVGVVIPAGSASAAPAPTPTASVAPATSRSAATVAVYVWGTSVAVRAYESANNCWNYPSTSCRLLGRVTKVSGQATCQKQGQSVTAEGTTNDWWTFLDPNGSVPGGWVSNIYIQGGHKIDGVPDCA